MATSAQPGAPAAPDPRSTPPHAVVLGAGLSGLTAAWKLEREGWQVTVLEASGRVGGVIHSYEDEGFLIEAGPNAFQLKSPEVLQALQDLGLMEVLVSAQPAARNRYIARGGRPVPVPLSPGTALGSPLFSTGAKLRVARELWVKRAADEDLSVAAFVRRRLGQEVLDYAIAPMVSGIFAGDTRELSIRHAFPKVWALEQNSGSLLKGALRLKLRGKRTFKPRMLSFQEGLETLPLYLAQGLQGLRCNTRLMGIGPLADGRWSLRWTGPDGVPHQQEAAAVIVALPAHRWDELPWARQLRTDLGAVPEIPHAPVVTCTLGFPKAFVPDPLEGFGCLIPPVEDSDLLGVIYASSLFPGRAMGNRVNLNLFMGGQLRPELAQAPEVELLERAQVALKDLLGIRGRPSLARLHRWPRAIPQYYVGYQKVLDGLARVERSYPGLHLLGSFRGGPGLNDVMLNALKLAARLSERPPGGAPLTSAQALPH